MTMRTKIILIVVSLGLFFLELAYLYSKNPNTELGLGLRLAVAVRETGEAEIIRGGVSQITKLEKRAELGNLDSLETFEIGEANLIFENGFRVRVFGNSLLTLERVNDSESYHVLLILKRGDVRVDQNGQDGSLFISKNGTKVSAQNYNDSDLKKAPAKPEFASAPESQPAVNSLSEEEIASTIGNFKTHFYRCYTHLLQKQPMARGQAQLNFLIINSGKPTDFNVTLKMTPEIKDDEFNKCIVEVLGRVQFKPFSGPSISTVFPLQFE